MVVLNPELHRIVDQPIERAALTLATEIAAAGWKPTGVRPYLSRAAFRNYVAASMSEPATAAGTEGIKADD